MPVRLPPVTEHASRILLEGIVDYAGVYPPAAMAMPAAVRNYAHYRASGAGWMLGRFVCPAAALEEFSRLAEPLLPRDAGAIPWRLTAVSSGEVAADIERIAAFNERHRVCFEECGALVDSFEARVSTAEELVRLDAALPRDLITFVEIPLAASTAVETLMPMLGTMGRRAKLRAGGVTADAFPPPAALVAFLARCIEHGVVAKATAGLHHPLRGAYRLTYAADAPSGTMYGFLNVFLAAALLAQDGDPAEAEALLQESNPEQLAISEFGVTWHGPSRDVTFDRAVLQLVRDRVLVSFGSCSFTEPVDEIRAMGWL
jgi:hypothetical protein